MSKRFERHDDKNTVYIGDVLLEPDSVYWMKETDIAWARNHSFKVKSRESSSEILHRRLCLDMMNISNRLTCSTRYYHFNMFDLTEVYMMVTLRGIVGVCERWLINPALEDKTSWDFRDEVIRTQPHVSVRACGRDLLSQMRKHLDEEMYNLRNMLS